MKINMDIRDRQRRKYEGKMKLNQFDQKIKFVIQIDMGIERRGIDGGTGKEREEINRRIRQNLEKKQKRIKIRIRDGRRGQKICTVLKAKV